MAKKTAKKPPGRKQSDKRELIDAGTDTGEAGFWSRWQNDVQTGPILRSRGDPVSFGAARIVAY